MGSLNKVTVIFPSGRLVRDAQFVNERIAKLSAEGFDLDLLWPQLESENGTSSGSALERAIYTSFALTTRKSHFIWAARGGFGVSEILPYLEYMLPPVIPAKTLIGFSDISLLGNFLCAKYKNLNYIHANHVFDSTLYVKETEGDRKLLFQLLKQDTPEPVDLESDFYTLPFRSKEFAALQANTSHEDHSHLSGHILPINLSLAAVYCSMKTSAPAEKFVLFTEDLNEPSYKILRIFDTLMLSGFLANCVGVVLGNFLNCPNAENESLAIPPVLKNLAQLLSNKTGLPILSTQSFGHDKNRLPLVAGAPCHLRISAHRAVIAISFNAELPSESVALPYIGKTTRSGQQSNEITSPKGTITPSFDGRHMHFIGIGGTGMASVAGLFIANGFSVTGSDNPIYPPMDATIKNIGVSPCVGYSAQNLLASNAARVVLANAISRVAADLSPNLEFEALLKEGIPTYSFPSALRQFFLSKSKNIVVSGTHGKTTLTSLLSHLLEATGHNPSFMIGGTPKNFGIGFRLKNPNLFILEGDEYDSALFDKGPKFLHYEPTVAIINNIEFDHADIYPNVEAIGEEFTRLALLCHARKGAVVVNYDDERARAIGAAAKGPVIYFSSKKETAQKIIEPTWTLLNYSTNRLGIHITCLTPWNEKIQFPSTLFGLHNATNAVCALAAIHSLHLLGEISNSRRDLNDTTQPQILAQFQSAARNSESGSFLPETARAFSRFEGVKRRFELVSDTNGILIYDDFAHHPTAIETTLRGFKDYMLAAGMQGRLIACFDPRNATMRRKILQLQLSQSFKDAELVFLGKVSVDKRISQEETLDANEVVKLIGTKAQCFLDNSLLLEKLVVEAKPEDVVVFMSSGSFDQLPSRFAEALNSKQPQRKLSSQKIVSI